MAKKEFNINEYSNAKILSPKKYVIWLKQIHAKDNNEEEMQQLVERLENDRKNAQYKRKKLFSKWWLKEIISAAAIIGAAFLGNALTAFSPFSFLLSGLILGAIVNVVALTVIPALRLPRYPSKRLLALENELKKQKELKNVKTDVKDLTKRQEKAKRLIDTEIKEQGEEKVLEPETKPSNLKPAIASEQTPKDTDSNSNKQPNTDDGTSSITGSKNIDDSKDQEKENNEEEVQTPTQEKELIDLDADKSKPRFIFKVKTRTMTANGECPNENVCVNISTTDLDKFIEELNKKMFEVKGLKTSRTKQARKANSMVLTVKNAKELIDKKLENGEITKRQAEKQKKDIAAVVLVVEITNMSNPSKGTIESRPYEIEEEKDFFQTVEKIKNRVLQQANELKESKSSQETM